MTKQLRELLGIRTIVIRVRVPSPITAGDYRGKLIQLAVDDKYISIIVELLP